MSYINLKYQKVLLIPNAPTLHGGKITYNDYGNLCKYIKDKLLPKYGYKYNCKYIFKCCKLAL